MSGPYSKPTVVGAPLEVTVPFNVAVVRSTAEAAPVVMIGESGAIATEAANSDVLLTVHVGRMMPKFPIRHCNCPFQSPPLEGVEVMGVTSVMVARMLLPPVAADSVVTQRPGRDPEQLVLPDAARRLPRRSVSTSASPRKFMVVALLSLLASMAKNSTRKLAGPCVATVQVMLVLPAAVAAAAEPLHGPEASDPRQISSGAWSRLA